MKISDARHTLDGRSNAGIRGANAKMLDEKELTLGAATPASAMNKTDQGAANQQIGC